MKTNQSVFEEGVRGVLGLQGGLAAGWWGEGSGVENSMQQLCARIQENLLQEVPGRVLHISEPEYQAWHMGFLSQGKGIMIRTKIPNAISCRHMAYLCYLHLLPYP